MFDFFGKHQYNHSEKTEWMIYPIDDVNYHQEVEWGVDALLVGKTSGLGGLTLYCGNDSWPVQNPGSQGDVKFTKRVLSAGPIRAAVEVVAENITPEHPDITLRLLCLIYAEHQESEIRVTVRGTPAGASLAPGLIKLVREETFFDRERGCFGTWGYQDDTIGDIGMGLIVPPRLVRRVIQLPDERHLLCDAPNGSFRFWIVGDWRRGRRFPVAPTIDNWRRELEGLADQLHHDMQVSLHSAETAKLLEEGGQAHFAPKTPQNEPVPDSSKIHW
jgi:hypothetical protein